MKRSDGVALVAGVLFGLAVVLAYKSVRPSAQTVTSKRTPDQLLSSWMVTWDNEPVGGRVRGAVMVSALRVADTIDTDMLEPDVRSWVQHLRHQRSLAEVH